MYNTKQRNDILTILKEHEKQSLTPKEILILLQNSVSKATLYRYLDVLEENGEILKIFNEINGSYAYEYISVDNHCKDHLHLKCLKCGKIIHLDCSVANQLIEHISYQHRFKIDQKSSVINGYCNNCLRRII